MMRGQPLHQRVARILLPFGPLTVSPCRTEGLVEVAGSVTSDCNGVHRQMTRAGFTHARDTILCVRGWVHKFKRNKVTNG